MSDREPIVSVTKKDLTFEFFRAGGKGGQGQNKTSSGVRVKHPPSGAVGECRETRSQLENKRRAFRRMADSPEFRSWLKREAARRLGQEKAIQESVAQAMQSRNLRVECKGEDGRWEECRAED